MADTEGNEEADAEEGCDEPAQEEAAIEGEVDAVANEQEAEASTAPAIEQTKRRGPQALPRVKLEPGAVNVRACKGKEYTVPILADGKHCSVNGQEYSSLSTAAFRMFDLHVCGVKFWQFVR